MVHVPGSDHGLILLVEMSTCPHCASTRALLDQLGVDYWYIDLNTLTSTEVAEVFSSINPLCGQGTDVPRLVIRGETCIVGDKQEAIREALK
jgi:glutaredoxin